MEIFWSEWMTPSKEFHPVFQMMANRLQIGHMRYGKADARKKYLDKARQELRAYSRNNNKENLLNAANYLVLEYLYPQYKKAFHDNTIDSVTRSETKK